MPSPSRRSTTRGSPTGRRRSKPTCGGPRTCSAGSATAAAAAGRGRRRRRRRRVGARRRLQRPLRLRRRRRVRRDVARRAARGNGSAAARRSLEALARDAEARVPPELLSRIFSKNQVSLCPRLGRAASARSACTTSTAGSTAHGRYRRGRAAPRRGRSRLSQTGTAHLVGAGPGDPGLLTVRALELIAAPTSILYDRLIPPARSTARARTPSSIDVGKEPGGAVPQERRSAPCSSSTAQRGQQRRAAQGRRPLRVRPRRRGGRGAARGRHPVRGRARHHRRRRRARLRRHPRHPPRRACAVAFVTGHEDPDKPETALDWAGARRASRARSSSTWASSACRASPSALIAAGRAADEPAAVIERGTLPGQRTVVGTLGHDRRRGGRGGNAPALDHRRRPRRRACASGSRWLEERPLNGRTRRRDARPRAGERRWPPGCARSAPRSSRRPRSASSPCPATPPDLDALPTSSA